MSRSPRDDFDRSQRGPPSPAGEPASIPPLLRQVLLRAGLLQVRPYGPRFQRPPERHATNLTHPSNERPRGALSAAGAGEGPVPSSLRLASGAARRWHFERRPAGAPARETEGRSILERPVPLAAQGHPRQGFLLSSGHRTAEHTHASPPRSSSAREADPARSRSGRPPPTASKEERRNCRAFARRPRGEQRRRSPCLAGAAGDTRFVWTSRRLLAGIAHSDRAQATAVRVQQAHLVVPRGRGVARPCHTPADNG
jgi:hypothetical protein